MKFKNRGYLILEILVASVLLGLVAVSVFPTVNFMFRRTRRAKYDTQASILLQEGVEVTQNIFSSAWDLYGYGDYHLVLDQTDSSRFKWALEAGQETGIEARFDRIISILPVCRDKVKGTRDTPGCEIDQGSRLIKTTISWQENSETKQLNAGLLLVKTLVQ